MLLKSMVCRYEQFESDWYAHWATRLGYPAIVSRTHPLGYRKVWEWAAIAQALHERGMLAPGRRGAGFAVGREPLPALFASLGVEVVGTDLGQENSQDTWTKTGQHAASREALFHANLVERDVFEKQVSFKTADMNNRDTFPEGPFDFVWSSCALEHLGSLDLGTTFIKNSLQVVKNGGVAVHTTEFNVSSNDDTASVGFNNLFRRRDLELLDCQLRPMKCGLDGQDFECGAHPFDLEYDFPPYFQGNGVHIKLQIENYIATSVLLIVQKGH